MDIASYIAENYGKCEMKSCACLKHGWIGTQCFSWKPFNASTYEELAEAQKEQCGNTGVKPSEVKLTTTIEKPTESPSSEPLGSLLTE